MEQGSGGCFYSTDAHGLVLAVKAQPKSSRDAIVGLMDTPDGQALKIAVTSAPENGKANAALMGIVAKAFGVAKSAVRVMSGATSRRKLLHVAGDPVKLSAVVQHWMKS